MHLAYTSIFSVLIAKMIQFFLNFVALLATFSAPAVAGTLEDLIKSDALPKSPGQPISSVPLINRVSDGAYETSVNLTIRPAYARTPIHIHANGGLACVLQGEETLYIENQAPLRVVAPNCYYMPSGPRMLAYNSGNTVSITYDIFKGLKGSAAWKVVEGNYSSTFGNQFGDIQPSGASGAATSSHQH